MPFSKFTKEFRHQTVFFFQHIFLFKRLDVARCIVTLNIFENVTYLKLFRSNARWFISSSPLWLFAQLRAKIVELVLCETRILHPHYIPFLRKSQEFQKNMQKARKILSRREIRRWILHQGGKKVLFFPPNTFSPIFSWIRILMSRFFYERKVRG